MELDPQLVGLELRPRPHLLAAGDGHLLHHLGEDPGVVGGVEAQAAVAVQRARLVEGDVGHRGGGAQRDSVHDGPDAAQRAVLLKRAVLQRQALVDAAGRRRARAEV
ncbi:MAG: hypothetical protein ACK559_37985, partial [bacterium]